MAGETIALQTMLPKIDNPADVQAQAMKMAQMAQAQQQAQQEYAYQQQQRQQAQADDSSYRQALQSSGGDNARMLSALSGAGNYKGYAQAQKSDLDLRKGNTDIEKDKATTQKTHFDILKEANSMVGSAAGALAQKPSYENAVAIVGQLKQRLGPEMAAQLGLDTLEIPRDPQQIAAWANQHYVASISADKQMEDARVKSEGEANRTVQVDNSKRSAASSKYSADSSAGSARARLNFDKEQAAGPDMDTSEATIKAIGEGRIAPPTGYALRNPKIAKMMDRVTALYPDYDATEYAGKTKAMRDFTTGKQGDSIRSFAVATEHLGQLSKLVDALDNGNVPLVNKYGNMVAQATGSVAPTNFDAAKGIVAKEVLKSIVAGGGGVEERQELAHLLDNAKTAKQLKGVIQTYEHLMGAQHDGLVRQYELSTGRKDAKTRFSYGKADAAPAAGGVVDFGSLK